MQSQCYVQAMYLAEKGDLKLRKNKRRRSFVKGHEAHASLIQKEAW